jgi:hypothetical protein
MSRRSSRARRGNRIRPPSHRRDFYGVPLPRIDPSGRCQPTRPLERVGRASPIGHLQRDVHIKRCTLNRIPAVVAARLHHQLSSRCHAVAVTVFDPQPVPRPAGAVGAPRCFADRDTPAPSIILLETRSLRAPIARLEPLDRPLQSQPEAQ